MNKKLVNLVIKIVSIVLVVVLISVGIYLFITIQKQKKEEYKTEVYNYLTTSYINESVASKSPLLGLLNYNFDEIKNDLSTQVLVYSNMMSNSQMNNIGINNIYNSKYGVSKSEYENKSNYIALPESNCYYHQNVLKKSGFNCDSVCSSNDKTIMQSITKNLQWDNVLPENIRTYCIKNALYPIDKGGYLVNINDLKELFKSLTNKELSLNSDITSNTYYEYNAYLVTNQQRLEDNIKKINSVENVSVNGNTYTAEYVALTDKELELKGTIILEKVDKKYYVVANKIETKYNLNN